MSKVVGIDLGTTNSLVAFVQGGKPAVIADESGDALLPSIVSVDAQDTVHVGREAQRRLLTDASRTVYSVKRFMGRGIEDVKDEERWFPFKISGETGGVVRIRLGDRELTPPEISGFILRELKRRAEAFFAREGDFDPEVAAAVITVPAYFNDAQRTATRDAGRLAGLEVLRIINEPTAACLAYGLDKRRQGIVAVYDLGGGTFDISILKVQDGVFQVLATNGDTHLGGDDIDRLLVEIVAKDLGLDPATQADAVQAVRKAVIQAKWDLSEFEETCIEVDRVPGRAEPYRRRITRAEFESLIAPIVARTLEPCKRALQDAALGASEVDEAVLVGGSTRIPMVRREVERLFGRKPHTDLNPDEVVAIGAAVQADILVSGRREMLLLDVTPLSLGIETMGGIVSKIILRNSTIPASGSEMFTTLRRQPDGGRHPHPAGRARDGLRQPVARPLQAARHPPDARGAAAHPGAVPDRRERHPERVGARTAHGDRADHRSEAVLRPHRRGSGAHAHRVVRARAGGRGRADAHRGPQRGRDDHRRH